ncbi:MAG: photosystem reaction center subunit H [Veillonellaceae bacterium]|jgi:uncharacterized protein YrrD|nr:photosystem reaction center subunit H [Veillonellaceae bacterium]
MKKGMDILGLPVIGITQGREIGTVKSFVINPDRGVVTALVIDDEKWYTGAKLLPMSAVIAIGEFAVTVESVENILGYKDIPDIERLLEADIKVTGTKVLTNTGRILGKVIEIIIDETGKISACEIERNNGESTQISSDQILTFGKEVLIISDKEAVKSPSVKVSVDSEYNVAVQTKKEFPTQSIAETKPEPEVKNETVDESAKKFDDRHRKYLLGKKASRRIETDNGVMIVDQGGEITEEVLQKAKLAGKFVELSMNIQ